MTTGSAYDAEVEDPFPASDPPSHSSVLGVGGPLEATPASTETARLRGQSAPPVHLVVVVGGGFGGLAVVRALAGAAVDVTLILLRKRL